MMLQRIFRHLVSSQWQARRAFPKPALTAIEQAIKRMEALHRGELRFVVEAALSPGEIWDKKTARARAIDVFSTLRIWDTEHNNGVLIYLLMADHSVEIVADRGINAKVNAQEWEHITQTMEVEFRQARFESGAVRGIEAVGRCLAQYFPVLNGVPNNELGDQPVIL